MESNDWSVLYRLAVRDKDGNAPILTVHLRLFSALLETRDRFRPWPHGAIKCVFENLENANIEAWKVFAEKWDDRQALEYEHKYEPGTTPQGLKR